MRIAAGLLFILCAIALAGLRAQAATEEELDQSPRYSSARDVHDNIMDTVKEIYTPAEAREMIAEMNKWAKEEWGKLAQANYNKGMHEIDALSEPLENYNSQWLDRMIGDMKKQVEEAKPAEAYSRAELDKLFADSRAMYDQARVYTYEDDKTAKELLLNAWKELKNSLSAQEPKGKEAAISAWFSANYARLKAGKESAGKELAVAARAEYNRAIAAAANRLGLAKEELGPYMHATLDYLAGKQPDDCGFAKSSLPVNSSLSMLLVDDGLGNYRHLYFNPNSPDNDYCARATGHMCYKILRKMPVTPAMKQAGVEGDQITLIEGCGGVD